MFQKILLAVNPSDPPFDTSIDLQQKLLKILEHFDRDFGNVVVEPVYVLAPEPIFTPLGFIGCDQTERLKALVGRLSQVEIKEMLPLRLLDSSLPGVKDQVDTLLHYAYANGYDLIAVGTHARKGFDRFFVGSFTETLLFNSHLPILTVNPATRIPDSIKELLVPSDFEPASRIAYEQILGLGKRWRAKIVIVHKQTTAPFPTPIGLYPSRTGLEESLELNAKIAERQTGEAEQWLDRARKRNVCCKMILDDSSLSVEDTILEHAHRLENGLIAMISRRGPLGAAILGSPTKGIVREANWPVIVIRLDTESSRMRSRQFVA